MALEALSSEIHQPTLGGIGMGVLMPNMIFIKPKPKLFGQNPLTKNICSSEKVTTHCEKKLKNHPLLHQMG